VGSVAGAQLGSGSTGSSTAGAHRFGGGLRVDEALREGSGAAGAGGSIAQSAGKPSESSDVASAAGADAMTPSSQQAASVPDASLADAVGNASSLAKNQTGEQATGVAAPERPAARVNPAADVEIFTGAESCQGQVACDPHPIDRRLIIADAGKVIDGSAGGVSFTLEPQWEGRNAGEPRRG
jgi:hypothetical protein